MMAEAPTTPTKGRCPSCGAVVRAYARQDGVVRVVVHEATVPAAGKNHVGGTPTTRIVYDQRLCHGSEGPAA